MKAGPEHYGQEIRESGEQKARKRIEVELKKLRWKGAELVERAEGDVAKIRITKILRQETTMTLEWIARALHMGPKHICPICTTGTW